ncbi:MAG: hypothetical protein GY827_07245 [Cytophagales bacterium]|nr:hypothetical protein [Cytophagales bacterium]
MEGKKLVRVRKYLLCLFYLLNLSLSWASLDSLSTKEDVIYHTRQELVADLDTLVACLERYHPSLYAFQSQDQWQQKIEQKRVVLSDSMTALDVYPIFASLVHDVECGHTAIKMSEEVVSWYEQYNMKLPMTLNLLNDTIFVLDPQDTKLPKGAIIHSIGKYHSKEILTKLDTTIIGKDGIREDHFNHRFSSHLFIDLFADPCQKVYEISYSELGSKKLEKTTVELCLKTWNEKHPTKQKLSDFFEYTKLDDKTAVLKIRTFKMFALIKLEKFWMRPFCQSLEDRIKYAFRHIKHDKIENLILDIRENEGGDPYLSYQICSYVLDEFQYFRGFTVNPSLPKKFRNRMQKYDSLGRTYYYDKPRALSFQRQKFDPIYKNNLYVLVNDGSYSTSIQLAALLQYHKRAAIVGKNTGGIANYCNAYHFVQYSLPNTHTSGIIPIFKVPLGVELSDTKGIIPDYYVPNTIQDVIQEKDVQLEFILEKIEEERNVGEYPYD